MLKGLLQHRVDISSWRRPASINRFAGADINSMLAFEDTFGTAVELQLTRTFRCPPEIVRFSRVCSTQPRPDPQVGLNNTPRARRRIGSPTTRRHQYEAIAAELERIEALAQANEGNHRPTVLALGRYSFDRDAIPSSLVPEGIDFVQDHSRRKGTRSRLRPSTESSVQRLGFPSTVVDDPILGLAMAKPTASCSPKRGGSFM